MPTQAAPEVDILSPLERRHYSSPAMAAIAELLTAGGVDLVHVEGHYLCRLLPRSLSLPLVVAENNIESDLIRQRMHLGDPRSMRELDIALLTTLRAQRSAWRRAAGVVTVTKADREQARRSTGGTPVHVVPDGADHLGLYFDVPRTEREVLFLANWGYEPNLDSAKWLLEEIGPRLAEDVPGIVVHLAGADAPSWLAAEVDARRWARLTSPVRDVAAVIDGATVVLCPLRVGGGVKVKVLEAMRRGMPVVTTSVGAQGIEAVHALCIADDAAGLAAATTVLLLDTFRRAEVRCAVRVAAADLPSWNDAADALGACWRQTLQAGRGRPVAGPTGSAA